eukprot:CAMPEP_0201661710 /NCGR_PEP_ID=MMETSP0494-20130426/3998_1 /ASSEMBLY_ACC=CAM_ASM_000839 /TAXON_ID=420259 /ORGANISM="Thalassiosira gravida, Strain GMp14c1" /LENGTH=684 /DNA_ID=CAMNT_0048139891 /DNA_START=148 /DNA_END=2202 /DNA_ORIENTATION=+
MALLRRMSSTISEVLSLGDDADLFADECHEPTGGGTPPSSIDGSGISINTGLSILSSCGATRPSDSLNDLGTANQSLMRTMRLDVVLLGSREEEMREALVQLESQWGMLEGFLEEQRRTEALEESAEDAEADDFDDGEDDDDLSWKKNKKKGGDHNDRNVNKNQCTSTIDWDGATDNDNKVKKKEIKKKIAIRKKAPEEVASQLANSNFEWPADDGDSMGSLEKVAQRASMLSSSGDTVSDIVSGRQIIAEAEEAERQQRKQQRGSGDRNNNNNEKRNWWGGKGRKDENVLPNSDTNSLSKTNNQDGGRNTEHSVSTTASTNSKTSQEIRGRWWGRNNSSVGKGSRNEDDPSESSSSAQKRGWWGRNNSSLDFDRDKTVVTEDNKSISTVGSMSANEKPAAFQLFGGRRMSQMNESINEEGIVNDASLGSGTQRGNDRRPANSPFQRIFQRNNNMDSTASMNTRDTVETQQSPCHSSDTSSSQQAANNNNNKSKQSAVENARVISALQVKLRGCNSAASTLEQLLSYQTRNLLDLRHERNTLRSASKFDARQSDKELNKLRSQLHSARVERRRKARFVEDAQKKMKKTQRQEELLKGELESIRTELFLLNKERTEAQGVAGSRGSGRGDNNVDGNDGGEGIGDSNHSRGIRDRVVIAGEGGGRSETASAIGGTTAEWRTGGYQQ